MIGGDRSRICCFYDVTLSGSLEPVAPNVLCVVFLVCFGCVFRVFVLLGVFLPIHPPF